MQAHGDDLTFLRDAVVAFRPVVAWRNGGGRVVVAGDGGRLSLGLLAWRAPREHVRELLVSEAVPALLGPTRNEWTVVRVLTTRRRVVEPGERRVVELVDFFARRLDSWGAAVAPFSWLSSWRSFALVTGAGWTVVKVPARVAPRDVDDPWTPDRVARRAAEAVALPAQLLDERFVGDPAPVREVAVVPGASRGAPQAAADALGRPVRAAWFGSDLVLAAEPTEGMFLDAAVPALGRNGRVVWTLWRQGGTRGVRREHTRGDRRLGPTGSAVWAPDWERVVDPRLQSDLWRVLARSLRLESGAGPAILSTGPARDSSLVARLRRRPSDVTLLPEVADALGLPRVAADVVDGADLARVPGSVLLTPRVGPVPVGGAGGSGRGGSGRGGSGRGGSAGGAAGASTGRVGVGGFGPDVPIQDD